MSTINNPTLAADTDADEETIADVAKINDCLSRLKSQKVTIIKVEGVLLQSKIAWKLATFYQPMLHRVVMLAEGCISSWNNNYVLSSYLAARALIETVSFVVDVDDRIYALLCNKEIGKIDALLQNRLFSTRDKNMISENPEINSINILTAIDHMDKKTIPGLRSCYDMLSERCHPNSSGAHQFFSSIDYHSYETVYSEDKWRKLNFQHLLSGLTMLQFFELCMKRSSVLIEDVASAHLAVIQDREHST